MDENRGPPKLKVYTLGRFLVYRGQDLISDDAWTRKTAKHLFLLLLLAPYQRQVKDEVAEILWPEYSPRKSANNLHRTLYVLRRILQPELKHGAESDYIRFEDDELYLTQDSIEFVDFREFEERVEQARFAADDIAMYESAHSLYKGRFLPENIYDEWSLQKRYQLEEVYKSLLDRLGRIYQNRADYPRSIVYFQELIEREPANEEIHRELMRLFARIGQRHKALELYQRLCDALRKEFSAEPATETTWLYRAIQDNQLPPEPVQSAPPLGSSIATPLIGRATEEQTLHTWLEEARRGKTTIVMVSGETGIGKTRLGAALATHAKKNGFQHLFGIAYEQEGYLPYGPFVDALRRYITPWHQQDLKDRLNAMFYELGRILPELVETSPQESEKEMLEMGLERQRLFDAIALTFKTLAREAPLYVLLDDFHAADESSFQLLHYLARRIKNVPILIVCTMKEEALQPGMAASQFYHEMQRHQLGYTLYLERLTPQQARQMCTLLLRHNLSVELCRSLYQLTAGNPLYLQEVALALAESEGIELRGGLWYLKENAQISIPETLHGTITIRLGRLRPETYRLASMMTVVGRKVSYDLLQKMTELRDDHLLDALDELIQAWIIQEEDGEYRFRHELTRQVLYDDLLGQRRIWLHKQAAVALEEIGSQPRAKHSAVLAYHYEKASQPEKALHYLLQAGDDAQRSYAAREALEYYDRALNLIEQHREADLAQMLPVLLDKQVKTYLALSEFDQAIRTLEQLLQIHRQAKAPAQEAEALYQLANAHYWAHRLQKAQDYLTEAIEGAERLVLADLLIRSLRLRDILSSTQGDNAEYASPYQERLANGDNLDKLTAEEHWGKAMLAHLHSDFPTAVEHAQACVRLGRAYLNNFLILGGYFILGMSYTSLGLFQQATEDLLGALQLSEAIGDRFWRARLLNTIGWVHRELYDFDSAIAYDRSSLEVARLNVPVLTEAEGNALANLALDYLMLGDYAQARLYINEGLSSAAEPFMRWRYQARMLLTKGQLALAEGKPGEALTITDQVLKIALQMQARKYISHSCRLRGQALLAQHVPQAALQALRHAHFVAQSLQSPLLVWPCSLDLAKAEELDGNPNAATAHYQEASTIITQIIGSLKDPGLIQSFSNAEPVQSALRRADHMRTGSQEVDHASL